MRIAPVQINKYYKAPQIKPSFTSSEKPKKDNSIDRLYTIWAATALSCLAMAYGGGKMIIKDYEENMNEIFDRYEKELQENKQRLDSLYNEIPTVDFEEVQE